MRISGEVTNGNHIGRSLGFPTANINSVVPRQVQDGVYAARAQVDGQCFGAMANVGTNPSVGGTSRRVEVHLLGFEGNLYGKHIDVELVSRIREERKFDSLDKLKAQIQLDKTEIEIILNK